MFGLQRQADAKRQGPRLGRLKRRKSEERQGHEERRKRSYVFVAFQESRIRGEIRYENTLTSLLEECKRRAFADAGMRDMADLKWAGEEDLGPGLHG